MNNTDNHDQLIGLIDFDGTLFETESLYDDCMDVLLHPHGITQLPRTAYKDPVADKYRFVTGTGWRIIIPCTVEHLTGGRLTPQETESLVHEFTDLVCDYAISSPIDHSYQPTIEFCKEIIGLDGRLSIHSGTEPEIVSTLLDHKGASDLFDVIVASNKTNKPDGGHTRYKKHLLSKLMDHYEHPESRGYSEPRAQGHHDHNDNGGHTAVNGDHTADLVLRFFVLGDSNGDAAAAEELDLPFIMARKQDDPAELTIRARTIHPSMSLVVDGDGSKIPGLTKKIFNN